MNAKRIENTNENWENRVLGADEASAALFAGDNARMDDALGMQMISIRLPKSLLDEMKLIAKVHGLGYQPLIRQSLQRFATSEIKRLIRDYADKVERGEVESPEIEPDQKQCA